MREKTTGKVRVVREKTTGKVRVHGMKSFCLFPISEYSASFLNKNMSIKSTFLTPSQKGKCKSISFKQKIRNPG